MGVQASELGASKCGRVGLLGGGLGSRRTEERDMAQPDVRVSWGKKSGALGCKKAPSRGRGQQHQQRLFAVSRKVKVAMEQQHSGTMLGSGAQFRVSRL